MNKQAYQSGVYQALYDFTKQSMHPALRAALGGAAGGIGGSALA